MLHPRLARLPAHEIARNAVVLEASNPIARLKGLALLREHDLPAGHALLVRPCSSVHTFGMRFAVDVAFAAGDGRVLRVIRGVPPRRVHRQPGAALALEAHAGELGRFLVDGRGAGARLPAGLFAGA